MPSQPQQIELFDEAELPKSDLTSLRVTGIAVDEMSPQQKKFNHLAKRIEKWRFDIAARNRELEEILTYWAGKIPDLEKSVAHKQIQLAQLVDAKVSGKKLGKRQRETAERIIIVLLDEAFATVEPEPSLHQLWERWAPNTYEKMMADQELYEAEMTAEMVKDMFGLNIDPEIVRQGPQAIAAAMHEQLGRGQERAKSTKKTKRQIQKEAQTQAADELSKKSLRSVYIALAKVLHPDVETDVNLKVEKEKFMQEVSGAYERKDLHTLLKLEMEWLSRENSHLAQVPEETLAVYVKVLADQEKELHAEYQSLNYNPRYQPIFDISSRTAKQAQKAVDQQEQELLEVSSSLNDLLAEVETSFSMPLLSAMLQAIGG